MPVRAAGAGSSSGGALGWACRPMTCGTALPTLRPCQYTVSSVMSNGSKTHSTFRPARNGSTEYTLPSTATVAVLRTCRITLQQNASFSSAGSGSAGAPAAARRACGACPVSVCDAGVVDGAQPRAEQAVQLLQVLDRVAGRVGVVAGDLGQELLLDSLEHAFDLAPAHRAGVPADCGPA